MSDFRFKTVGELIKGNPVFQFAQKAIAPSPVFLSQQFSPTAQGSGLGQHLGGDQDMTHLESVKRNNIFFNMMKFRMQARSV